MGKKRKGGRRKYLFLSLLVLFVLILAGLILSVTKRVVWNGQSRLSVIVDAGEIYLFSFSPEEKKLMLVKAQGATYVEVPYGFGFYPFGAVYQLGEMEKRGGEVLAFTAQELFAIPIDGWLKVDSPRLEITSESSAKTQLLKILFSQRSRSNLTILDRARFWWQIRQVRLDKIKFFNLDSIGVLSDSQVNTAQLDTLLSPFLTEPKIQEESLKVEILNSTEKQGLGGRVGRLVTNLGATVISVDNQGEKLDQCLIKVEKENMGKKTVERLREIFACQVKESDLEETRGNLVFIVGEDYWQKLKGREN